MIKEITLKEAKKIVDDMYQKRWIECGVEKANQEIEEALSKLNAYKLKEEAIKIASGKELPIFLLNIIDYTKENAESIKTKIDEIEVVYKQVIQSGINDRMKEKYTKKDEKPVKDTQQEYEELIQEQERLKEKQKEYEQMQEQYDKAIYVKKTMIFKQEYLDIIDGLATINDMQIKDVLNQLLGRAISELDIKVKDKALKTGKKTKPVKENKNIF